MHVSPLIAPVVALVAWSLVMLVWMAIARAPLVRGRVPDGARGADLEAAKPGPAHWPAHNYMHLMEQPTIFYAIALTLALLGMGSGINYWLAWGYVGLRIVHSLIQSTVNIVAYRFTVFALASFCLLGLTVHAGARILHDCGLI